MKKQIVFLTLGLLLIGSSLYAEKGDLIVRGNAGIGTMNLVSKLTVSGGSANWNEITQGLTPGSFHLNPGIDTDHFGSAITFGASDAGNGENAQAGIYLRSDGTYGTKMYFSTTDAYVIGAKTRMMIDHLGNVGIGTKSPVSLLTVGNGTYPVSALAGINVATGGNSYVTVSDNTRQVLFGADTSNYGMVGTFSNHDFVVRTNNTERLRVTTGGNVGIGTTTPQASLEIGGNPANAIRTAYLNISAGNTPVADRPYIRGTSSHLVINGGGTTSGGPLYLNYTGDGATGDVRIRENLFVMSSGNVGIGTTNPLSKLSVGGDGTTYTGIYGYGTSYGVYGSGGTGVHGTGSIGVVGMSSGSSGRGVYGSASGQYAAGVYGGAGGNNGYAIYGVSTGAYGYGVYCYAYNANGCGGNRSWYYSSDETLKENVSTVSDALTKVKQLRGVSYNWKADTEKKRQIGMLAQEVKNVIPEAVGLDPDGNLTMSDGPLIALLTEAIKEQQKQIEALKAAILELQKK